MSWVRILAPLSGASDEDVALSAAAELATAFDAELTAVYAPLDAADLMAWSGDGFLGGAQVAALNGLREAAALGESAARARFEACPYPRKTFSPLASPVTAALCGEARLSDVVVFPPRAVQGAGPLAEPFQQVLIEERRPVLIPRNPIVSTGGFIALAWDGGREATRAARSAVPLLCRASRVVILAATGATPRSYAPASLAAYLAARGVAAEVEVLPQAGEAAPILLAAAKAIKADILVAGAFGHPRFQQFIFGGVTRGLLQAREAPSLFLSH